MSNPNTSKPANPEITIKLQRKIDKEQRRIIEGILKTAIQEAMAEASIEGPYKGLIISTDGEKETRHEFDIEELEE